MQKMVIGIFEDFKQSIEKEICGHIFPSEDLKLVLNWVGNFFISANYGKYHLTDLANTKYIKIHQKQRCGVANVVTVS